METFLIVMIFVIVAIVVRAVTGDDSDEEPWEWKLREIKKKIMEEHKDKKQNEVMITGDEIQAEIGTRDLLLCVLTQIGCQYTISEDERIHFDYQGEHLWAEAVNECRFINVYDTGWENCELYDVEKVARLKQAINTVNLKETVTVLYSLDTEDDMMWVHCKKNFLFIPQIPDVDSYLKSMFAALFQAHHALGAEMEKLKNEE